MGASPELSHQSWLGCPDQSDPACPVIELSTVPGYGVLDGSCAEIGSGDAVVLPLFPDVKDKESAVASVGQHNPRGDEVSHGVDVLEGYRRTIWEQCEKWYGSAEAEGTPLHVATVRSDDLQVAAGGVAGIVERRLARQVEEHLNETRHTLRNAGFDVEKKILSGPSVTARFALMARILGSGYNPNDPEACAIAAEYADMTSRVAAMSRWVETTKADRELFDALEAQGGKDRMTAFTPASRWRAHKALKALAVRSESSYEKRGMEDGHNHGEVRWLGKFKSTGKHHTQGGRLQRGLARAKALFS